MGAYRDDDGKPYVLPSVLAAEAKMTAQGINKEYAGMQGVPAFVAQSLKFAVRPTTTPAHAQATRCAPPPHPCAGEAASHARETAQYADAGNAIADGRVAGVQVTHPLPRASASASACTALQATEPCSHLRAGACRWLGPSVPSRRADHVWHRRVLSRGLLLQEVHPGARHHLCAAPPAAPSLRSRSLGGVERR